jgi:modulator of FtsH protease
VPGQPVSTVGIEVLVSGIIIWGIVTYLDIKRLRRTKHIYWQYEPPRLFLTQLASLPYLIAGVVLLSGSENGMYWMVPAVIFSFLKTFADAWVLLVEINR